MSSMNNAQLAAYYARKGAESLASRALKPLINRTAPWTLEARPEPAFGEIDAQLHELSGLTEIQRVRIDVAAFHSWAQRAQYPALAYLVNRDEKLLEHYVSIELLGNPENATLVDVASCRSFFPDLMRRRGCRVIAQDLSYPAGLRGDRLGGDAAEMDLPQGSIRGMTLHCSFEHFERDADTRFVSNAGRLLEHGGRVAILPLYLSHVYCIEMDPLVARGEIPIDAGAKRVASFGYGNRHGRHYDIAALRRRVIEPAVKSGLRAVIYIIENAKDVSPSCYLRYALVLER